jgi:hypothetical protein
MLQQRPKPLADRVGSDVRAACGYPQLEKLSAFSGNSCNKHSLVCVVYTKGNRNLRKFSNERAIPWPILHISFISRRNFVLLVFPRGEEGQAGQLGFLMTRWGIAACALLCRFVMTTARRSWNFTIGLPPLSHNGTDSREEKRA